MTRGLMQARFPLPSISFDRFDTASTRLVATAGPLTGTSGFRATVIEWPILAVGALRPNKPPGGPWLGGRAG
jgi:hypothetical protein